MNSTKKLVLGVAVGFLSNMAFAQSLQEGINYIDANKYALAKKNFEDMIAKSPSADNYFYLGNTFLSQNEPNFDQAHEFFNKGLAVDKRSYLNKIGLASVKLGKGDKSAVAEIQAVVADSREKDPEVLYRAGEALTLFEKNNSPELAIDYLVKAIDKATKNGVPAHYYYTLGDAYRLKRDPGSAMTAYDKASVVAKNKASVFTRMGTLWMAAQQWPQAIEKINAAIAVDPSYAPAYKAKASYDIRYQKNELATQDLINYSKYADEDPYTQLEIAKLYFTNDDFANSKATLDKVFDKVDDPIKYKLKAYLDYQADNNYAAAKANLDKFMSTVKEKNRILPADQGLMGLIMAGLAQSEKDAALKSQLIAEATQKIAIANAAKDTTMDWSAEMAKIQSGGGISEEAVNAGPTNPTIEGLKAKVKANPKDADALVKLGTAYTEAKNWSGAVVTWDKMISLAPDWVYSYYAKGSAYQQLGNNDMAENSYQKFIDMVLKKPQAEQDQNKDSLSYAYYLVAYFNQTKDLAKAKEYAAKAVQLNPTFEDAVNFNKQINK
ncbi:tetratricopeptide repeat protein [Amniculibacterium aquaticum]|jgi:tetratricopeptide (TPR) repeat protein|uniref:tetratricopeptide repeat protein n=1 Tax=Amniculibacterium aquaticum TaxID=2479858 RepID=UPI000F5ABF21|nr:tetratricopeptide repeat protein [Amniculibacterium aquaticum]